MYKSILSLLAVTIILTGCNSKPNPFQIGKQNVGLLTDSTLFKDLKKIYPNDSIVVQISNHEFTENTNDIEIYEKSGRKLLILTPKEGLNTMAYIKEIQIIDSRFKTDKNISTLSTFKDISSHYKISKISNLINAIHIKVNDINASFVIDKKELPENLRFNMDLKIEAIHIPDDARIKYFFINWNKN